MKEFVKHVFPGMLALVLVLALANIDSSVLVKADDFSYFAKTVDNSSVIEEWQMDKNTVLDDVNEGKVNTKKNIEDGKTPLGAAEDTCYIHWIVLILSLLVGGYTIVRIVVANRQKEAVTNES